MNLSFQASSKTSNDWMLLKMLRDPSKKWRVDVFGQSLGEERWLPLFSKVVGLSDDAADAGSVSSERITESPLPAVEPWVIPNESMRSMERVEGRWL